MTPRPSHLQAVPDPPPRRAAAAAGGRYSKAPARDPEMSQWLAARSDDELIRLLLARPDVAAPSPATIEILAARLQLPQAALRAADELDLPTLTVLAAAERAGAGRGPVTEAAVVAQLPYPAARRPAAARARIREALGELRDRGLLWGPDKALRLAAGLAESVALEQVVLPRAGEATGAELDAALAAATERARTVLSRIAHGPVPRGRLPAGASAAGEAVRDELAQLARAGVLAVDEDEVTPSAHALFRERFGHDGKDLLAPPDWPGTEVGTGARDGAAGVAGIEFDHLVGRVLDVLERAPLAQLRDGGVGIRELRRVAAEARMEVQDVVIVVELLAAAELLADGDTTVGDQPFYDVWAPTPAADRWRESELAERLAWLAATWWSMPRTPHRIAADGAPLEVLVRENLRVAALQERADAVAALALLPPDRDTTETGFTELVRWHRPRAVGAGAVGRLREVLGEARRLGLVSGWGLSTVGRALAVLEPRPDATELRALLAARYQQILPAPVSELIVQADHTILAPGPLTAELAAEVALFAEVETPGAATTYRITEASLRTAFDAGRTAAGINELLETTSVTPVPQAVAYLVEDAARRHGTLRVGGAAAFLRSDDTALVAELAAGPLAARLGLRRIAPTVIICPDRPRSVLAELRGAGYAPVAEDAAGNVVDLTRERARVDPALQPGPGYAQTSLGRPHLSADAAEQAVGTMRSAERAGATAAGRKTGEAAVALLHEAAAQGRAVAVAVVDAAGRTASGMLLPLHVGAGRVSGIDPHSGATREYSLHRIVSVADSAD